MPRWWERSPAGSEITPLPWLHPDAIAYLENLLQPEFKVLEHGSGGSTLWFAERVAHVTAVEQNEDWLKALHERAPKNVTLIYDNYPSARLFRKKNDLLLIDGEPVIVREAYLDAAERMVKAGGYVVLDNANRPEYAAARARLGDRADLLHRVDGNSPGTLYLVTEFYRLKGGDSEN